MPLTTDARSSRGGRRGTQRARFALYLCLAFVTGCTAVSNFGHFHFGSDAGPEQPPPEPDAGDKPDTSTGCTASADTESDCSDRHDNDCDGREDCDDSDCAGDSHCCKPNEIPEVSCSGGVDNDCDGLIDCEDPNCASSKSCCAASGPEVGTRACTDAVDNDCDGVIDCDESSCAAQSACCNASGEEKELTECTDGVDNDCDGKKDCADPDCAGVSECCTKTEPVEISCGDAKDNDCDGNADCRDSDCENRPICQCTPTESSETNCSDLKDNDCDRDRDCLDPDCEKSLDCCVKTGAEQGDGACSDDKDNDCDGLIDCKDTDCNTSVDCCQATGSESGDTACSDGLDNDCDGLKDCDDDACSTAQHCCVPVGDEVGTLACNDGLDNDCNNEKDCADRKCGSSTSCCVANGTESSQPNDGKDNDCNGQIDIAQASMTLPAPGQPVAGNEVAITMVPSVVASATLECNTRRIVNLAMQGSWRPCTMDGNTIKPFDDSAAADANNDGAWITEVRWNFSTSGNSEAFSFRYYIHHTLYKVKHCDQISDDKWFDFAKKRLGEAKVFRPGDKADTSLAGPFVHVTYTPPNANAISANFFQDGTPQTVDMWSLRRRFALDPENKFLLITRNYESSRYGICQAAVIRFHFKNYISAYYCDAVVLNRAGAGVCINNNNGTMSFGHDSNDPLADKMGWPKANKFMWRQLLEAGVRGKVPNTSSGYQFQENLGYRNFMPKCTSSPCKNKNAIYLPDRSFFP